MITCLSWQLITGLIICIILAWALPRKLQAGGILLCTVVLLLIVAPLSLCVLSISTTAVYFAVTRRQPHTAVVIAITGALGAIFAFFKLRTAFSGEMNFIPLGISFYTLREIHYVLESYKNKLPSRKFYDLICYLFFLPTFIVGPINRFNQFVRDLRRRRWNPVFFAKGLERILFGYCKVVVLANYVVSTQLAQYATHLDNGKLARTYIDAVIAWMNLYIQFSGYSDIAIGFAALAGFEIMENFRFPFLACNINEFWKRWHISLTSWCRDYVYEPTVSITRKPFLSVCSAMIILGLWHEFSIRYILWGVYHGLGITVWHFFKKFKPQFASAEHSIARHTGRIIGCFITLNFVILSYPITLYLYNKLALYWER